MWSIHDLKVLFHAHCIVGAWPLGDTSALHDSTKRLLSHGLIERRQSDGHYATTDRGEALIEIICATPVPVQKFVDPRFFD